MDTNNNEEWLKLGQLHWGRVSQITDVWVTLGTLHARDASGREHILYRGDDGNEILDRLEALGIEHGIGRLTDDMRRRRRRNG